MAAVVGFVEDGLFLDPRAGKNTGIVDVLIRLAEDADEARRQLCGSGRTLCSTAPRGSCNK